MKTNGMFVPARPDGTKDESLAVPALIVGPFAITRTKQAKGSFYYLNHLVTGAGLRGHSKLGAVQLAADELTKLPIDWSSIVTIAEFNALPDAVRNTVPGVIIDAFARFEREEKARKQERREKLITSDAVYREGVPYSEAPPSKTYKYNMPGGALLAGTVDGESWVSDGHLAHIGTVPDGTPSKDAPIERVIPTRFEEEAYPVAYFLHPKGSRLVVLSNGVTLNYDMFKFLMRRFKGAVIKTNTKTSPVGYVVEGKTVAIQMPVIPVGGGLPENVARMVEQAACVTS